MGSTKNVKQGGVGKTTSGINIASALSKRGMKVLLVDNDPQGDVSKALRQTDSVNTTLANLLLSVLDMGKNMDFGGSIIPISDNFHMLPSDRRLVGVQNRIVYERASADIFDEGNGISSERILNFTLDAMRPLYDYIIIDCPPSLSMLTINALVAADSVLLPVEAHVLSFDDISETLATINGVKKRFNPDLQIEGILPTKFQGNTNLGRNIMKLVKENYCESIPLFKQPIPYAIKLAEQPAHGVSIHELDPYSKASEAYDLVAKELILNA